MQLTPNIIIKLLFTVSIFVIFTKIYRNLYCGSISFIGKCYTSLMESDNFICEPDNAWNERKRIYHIQDKRNMLKAADKFFFQSNWEANFHCSHARRIGKLGDGGKWVCDVHRLKYQSDCVIYSAGSHGDFSFEIGMKEVVPRCEIHTFDRDLYSCPKNVCTFHQISLGNGTISTESVDWGAIIERLNHSKRQIEIFKIDIDGGEYAFMPLIFKSTNAWFPRQILMEIHERAYNDVHSLFELLRSKDYVIFNKEANLEGCCQTFEYALLKLNLRFFNYDEQYSDGD